MSSLFSSDFFSILFRVSSNLFPLLLSHSVSSFFSIFFTPKMRRNFLKFLHISLIFYSILFLCLQTNNLKKSVPFFVYLARTLLFFFLSSLSALSIFHCLSMSININVLLNYPGPFHFFPLHFVCLLLPPIFLLTCFFFVLFVFLLFLFDP